jgi:hypothetical protein
MRIHARFLSAAVAVTVAASLPAQWPSSPSTNLSVADGTGEQVLPKIAALRDGGSYVGWFDSRNGSYEVRLQRLDKDGVEQWAHNGIVVSNNPQSTSLVDWDLVCDSDDHCVLTFTDTRAGGDLDCYAYRITPAGTQLWGTNGVALSNNVDFEANPRVVEASDGDLVFTWVNSGTRTVRVQRLDRAGTPRFAQDGVGFAGDTGATPGFVQMVASDSGSVILTWMRATSFTAQRHLHAMKFDVLGNAVWNGGVRLPIFDQASVPIAHQHKMQADGLGGAFVSWHFAVGSAFTARVQRLDASGLEVFAHNGVDLSTNTNNKFDPAMAVDVATQSVIAYFNERNATQSQWGISAQRLDGAGNRLWGASGVTLVPVGSINYVAPQAAAFCNGAMGFVFEQSLGGTAGALRAFQLDFNGVSSWAAPVYVSNVVSDKLRLQAMSSTSGNATLAWTDLRGAGGDLVMQTIGSNAQLAPGLAASLSYGCGLNPTSSLVASTSPSLCGTVTFSIDNPLGTQSPFSLPVLVLATAPLVTFPCGAPLPGYGMAGNGAAGELLVDLATQAGSFILPPWLGAGQPSSLPLAIPYDTAFVGVPLYFQGALVDFAPGTQVPISLTSAVRWTLGY